MKLYFDSLTTLKVIHAESPIVIFFGTYGSVVYATRHCSVQQITRLFQRCHFAYFGDLVTKFSEFGDFLKPWWEKNSLDPPKWDLPMNFELPRPSKLALPMSFLAP